MMGVLWTALAFILTYGRPYIGLVFLRNNKFDALDQNKTSSSNAYMHNCTQRILYPMTEYGVKHINIYKAIASKFIFIYGVNVYLQIFCSW